jgi:NTE family protein
MVRLFRFVKQGRFCVLLLLVLVLAGGVSARPKIGLALGGGGAKGGAHIGLLKILERENIPVDYIAGTSIGSLIGAFYSLGYRAEEIETIMLSVPWEYGYSDTIPRRKLPYRHKQRDQFNFPVNLGYQNGELKTPRGLLYGQNASLLLREAFGNISNFNSFDNLPIPYRAVATDLSTNETVLIDSGDLLTAIKASSSVPGILAPVEYDDKLLVDGGITNNMPVDVVKAMGADIVIAVDIGDELVGAEALNSTVSVLAQLSSFLTVTSATRQKNFMSDNDVLIRPDIKDLSTTDWSTFSVGILQGELAAEDKIDQLTRLSLSKQEYASYSNQKQQRHQILVSQLEKPLTSVSIENQSSVNTAYIQEHLALDDVEHITSENLVEAIHRVYALDEFQRVQSTITELEHGRQLQVIAQEKSWGPNFLEFGLGWETNFTDQSSIDLDFAYTATNMTDYGGEWRTQLELGNEQAFSSEFYMPLTPVRSVFSTTRYAYNAIDWTVHSSFNSSLNVVQNNNRVSQGAGYNFSKNSFVELGLLAEMGQLSNDFAFNDDITYDAYGAYLEFAYDSLDSSSFPSQGKRLIVNVTRRNEHVHNTTLFTGDVSNFGAESVLLELEWKGAFHIGSHAVVSKVDFARLYTDNNEESVNGSRLGGFLNLSGYDINTLSGSHKALVALIYQYNLRQNLFGQTKLPFYLGVSAEAGNVWGQAQAIDVDDMLLAGSVYLGTDTKMGPVALGYGHSESNEASVYFFLGYKL